MGITAGQLEAIQAAAVATAGPWDPVTTFVGVGTALTDMGLETIITDITIATGAMGTGLEVTTWAGPYTLVDGTVYYESPLKTFVPASTSEAQTLVVWFMSTLATGGVLKYYATIAPPVALSGPTTPWNIVVRLTLPPGGPWEESITFDG